MLSLRLGLMISGQYPEYLKGMETDANIPCAADSKGNSTVSSTFLEQTQQIKQPVLSRLVDQ
jgi:hypothetical protein